MRERHGRVYKVVNDVDNKIYIGSTNQLLCKRMAAHRSSARKDRIGCLWGHMRDIGIPHFKILLVEDMKMCTIEMLRAREHHHIVQNDTVKTGLNGRYEVGHKCHHGARRSRCKDCDGASICEHKREKSKCKECGGGSICEHKKQKSKCKPCGGASICEHKKQRSTCKLCNGDKYKCVTCVKTLCGKQSLARHNKTQRHIKNLAK